MKTKRGKYIRTKEIKEKLRNTHLGNKAWNKDKKGIYSQEVLERMSKSHIGKAPWNKGKKWPIAIKRNMNETRIGKKQSEETKIKRGIYTRGEKHHSWKGGISINVHSTSEPRYKKWRNNVFERDSWTCQTCRARGVYLEAHHIKSWTKYPELRYILDNGVTLCRECHKLTNNWRGKKQNG